MGLSDAVGGCRARGLRREQVALPASIGPDYDMRVKQGRGQASEPVLGTLARVLRLEDAERACMLAFPGRVAAGPCRRTTQSRFSRACGAYWTACPPHRPSLWAGARASSPETPWWPPCSPLRAGPGEVPQLRTTDLPRAGRQSVVAGLGVGSADDLGGSCAWRPSGSGRSTARRAGGRVGASGFRIPALVGHPSRRPPEVRHQSAEPSGRRSAHPRLVLPHFHR